MQAEKSRRARLRERFDRFLDGRPPSDPLYLSNRTWKQKLSFGALIAAPAVILLALLAIGSTGMFRLNNVDPYEHSVAETAPPAPPKIAADPKLNRPDLEVLNIQFIQAPGKPVVSGIVRNNTDRIVDSAEVSYYLSDSRGSLIGSETTTVRNIEAHASVPFRATVMSPNAAYVLVREVRPL
jgi:hypothetical protein